MLRIVFFIIAIYFLYKFIFDFLLPVFRATGKMQHNIRSMQERMDEQIKAQQKAQSKQPEKEKPVKHEYIDFEEVK